MTILKSGGGKTPPLRHTLNNIDEIERTANCAGCGGTVLIQRHKRQGWRCGPANSGGAVYRPFKKEACLWCGFVGHQCQLDVDHIDNNNANNRRSNFQTLCARCHRLKTWMTRVAIPEQDWLAIRERYGAVSYEVVIDLSTQSER